MVYEDGQGGGREIRSCSSKYGETAVEITRDEGT